MVAGPDAWVPPEERRIGMVFQDYALFPHLDVAANITFGLQGVGRAEKAERVEELLALVGLSGINKRMPFELSGGQQQRVALARALAPRPDVILLDEPFSNLDTALRQQVRSEVKAILRAAGITSVFVTHDQEEAFSLADQVIVMFDGHIEQAGTPQEVYIRPASPQVAGFVGEANFLEGTASGDHAESPLGTLALAEQQDGPVLLMVRPEAITVNHHGINAQVEQVEFYGHSQRLKVRTEDGIGLIVRTNALFDVHPNQSVGLAINTPVHAFPT
jgi:iron(III) transport system ATP-binding protein